MEIEANQTLINYAARSKRSLAKLRALQSDWHGFSANCVRFAAKSQVAQSLSSLAPLLRVVLEHLRTKAFSTGWGLKLQVAFATEVAASRIE